MSLCSQKQVERQRESSGVGTQKRTTDNVRCAEKKTLVNCVIFNFVLLHELHRQDYSTYSWPIHFRTISLSPIQEVTVARRGHQKSMERKLEVDSGSQLFLSGWPHDSETRF